MRRLTVSIALVAVLACPAAAAARPQVEIAVTPRAGVPFGGTHRIVGTVMDGDRALANQAVILEARRYPFRDDFQALKTASTRRDGSFEFDAPLDRDHDVRVVAPGVKAQSGAVRTYTFPRTRLSYETLRRNVVRITMSYATPRDVVLTASTAFYVGRRSARSAPFRARARTRRTRAGQFRAVATIRVPASYRGRFRFATCFRASGGMGDPRATCPRRRYEFDGR